MVDALEEIQIDDFQFVGARDYSAWKYMALLIMLIRGKVMQDPY